MSCAYDTHNSTEITYYIIINYLSISKLLEIFNNFTDVRVYTFMRNLKAYRMFLICKNETK